MTLKGNLTDLSLADIVQLSCQSGQQARLVIERDKATAYVYFAGGEVIHAEAGGVQGEKAFYRLLTWETGQFVVEADVAAPTRTIQLPWSVLLMEGLRQLDENRQMMQSSGSDKEATAMAGETRREKLSSVLHGIVQNSGDIKGVAVVSPDGLIMDAELPPKTDQARVGAVAAALLSLSGRSVGQMDRGQFEQTLIQGSDGNIIITPAGKNALFVALTGKNVNLGMVFLEVREGAQTIAELLG